MSGTMKWLSPQPSTPCLCRYSSLHRPLAISSLSWRTAVPSHAVPLEHRRLPSTPGHVGRLRLRLTRRRADGGHGSSSDARNTASVAAQEGGDGTGRGPWVDGAHGANPEILRDVMRRKTTQAPAFDTRAAMNQLWVVWGICCFVERGWRFGICLVMSGMEGGFRAIAICGFLQHLAALLFAPAAGRIMDRTSRVASLTLILAVQNLLVVLTAGFMLWGIGNPHFLTQPASLAALTALQVVQRVANSLSDVAIERDWVVVLSQRDPGLLAEGNAQIRRIDQVGEITSTLIFGAACTAVGTPASLVGTVAVALALTPVQLGAIFALRRLCGPALARQWVAGGQGEKRGPLTLAGALAGAMRGVEAAKEAARTYLPDMRDSWALFFRQPAVLPSLAIVALFFNTAMAPTGVLTAFLTAQGMSGTATAVFRGACAALGLVGIWIGTRVIKMTGVVKAGAIALTMQLGLCLVATACFFAFHLGVTPTGDPWSALSSASTGVSGVPLLLLLFCGAVALSRAGLWMYDMVDAQVFQMMVRPSVASTVSSVEAAMCSLTELIMMGVAVVLADVKNYAVLVAMSMASLCLATVIYGVWMLRGAGSEYEKSEAEASMSWDEEYPVSVSAA